VATHDPAQSGWYHLAVLISINLNTLTLNPLTNTADGHLEEVL